MTKKRLLSAFLSLCMVFSMVPAAFAEGETENQASMEQSIILSDETGSDVDTDENQNDSEPPLDDNSVAKIDSENALLQAIAAAESGETITLSGDVEITETIIIKDKTLTLDLGEHTITAKQPIWKDPSDNSENNWSLISVRGSSNVTITGNGKLQALKDDSYAVDVYDKDSTCTIESGTFDGNISAIYVFQGKLIIEGGTFSIQQTETSGDPHRFLLNCYDEYYKNKTASITVKGGTFENFNPADCLAEGTGTNFCAAGHKSTPTADDSWTVEQLPYVAAIGDKQYYTLAEAVTEAKDGDTITMVNDAQLNSAVEINKELTLDLAGHTITGSASALSAIAVTGNLTITDSTAKEEPVVSPDYETVDYEAGKIEIASSKGAAVSVQEGGQLTVEGGILKNTKNIGLGVHGNSDPETWSTPIGSTATINGGLVLAREYGIGVYGNGAVLNVNDGVISTVDNAAVAGNGSCNGEVNHGGTTIHISGGTLIGHITTPGYIANGIYHPQSGVLNITGGTIYADNGLGVLMRNGELNVSENATIIATGDESGQVGDHPANVPGNTVVIDFAEDYNHNNEPNDTRKVSISGGYFSANQDTITVVDGENNKSVDSFVTGGSFTKQPDASYIADGCVVVNSGDANYPYLIQQAESVEEAKAVAEVADPSVDDSQLSHLTEDQKNAVVAAAESVDVSSNVMQTESDAAFEEVKKDGTIVDDAVKALNQELHYSVSAEDVMLFVQVYLDITPKAYDSGEKTFTLDITPMSRIVASTKDVKDSDNLVIQGEQEAEDTPNAVVVGDPKELDITDTVEMTIQLPSAFSDVTTAYVVHTKGDNTQYLYDGQVANNVLTFTNPNGFSDFTVYGEDPAVARVYTSDDTEGETGTGYMTLQQAIGAVTDNGYIVVKKDDSASVSRSISFTVSEENNAVASISAGRGYRMTKVENENGSVTYTFSRRSSSSSNSGSTGGIGTRLPVAGSGGTPSVTGFESDTNADLTVDGRYQFRITSLDGHTPVLTVNNSNFTVTLASQSGRDYFYVITCAGTPGSTAAVSVDGKYLLTATVGGSASGVVSDTTHPFTVAQGGTYQFRLTAAARPSFAAGSASFTVEYAGQEGNDYFYKVHAVGQAGDGCGFYINGEAQPVAVATIA